MSSELNRLPAFTSSPRRSETTSTSVGSSSLQTLDDDDLAFFDDKCISECELPTATLFGINEIVNDERSALNPLAEPFIPAKGHKASKVRVMPPWIKLFEAGARTERLGAACGERARRAASLLSMIQWTPPLVAELAQHFVWMACDQQPHNGLAHFAVEIHRSLHLDDSHLADQFLRHLKQQVMEYFRSCWNTQTYKKALSYRLAPSLNYIQSAYMLSGFIGELFSLNILQASDVHSCLDTLLDELCSHEHVQAIYNIIVYAQAKFWYSLQNGASRLDQPLIEKFLHTFHQRVSVLQEKSSFSGQRLSRDQCERNIRGVVDLIEKWRDEAGIVCA